MYVFNELITLTWQEIISDDDLDRILTRRVASEGDGSGYRVLNDASDDVIQTVQ